MTMAIATAEVKVDGSKIVLPTGATLSISIANEDQKEEEIMMEHLESGRINALFPNDDIDFIININNKTSHCGLLFETIFNNDSSWYSIDPHAEEKLQTVVTKAGTLEKMHFKNEDSEEEDDENFHLKTSNETEVRDSETSSSSCSNIRFSVKVEPPTMEKPVAIVRPLSPHVCVCGSHNTCIYIQNGVDETLPLMVDLDFTVKALKQLISDKYGVDVHRQALLFGGVTLAAHHKLADYRICEESTVQLETGLLSVDKMAHSDTTENLQLKHKLKQTIKSRQQFRSESSYDIKPFTIELRLTSSSCETDCKAIELVDSDIKIRDPTTATVYLNEVLCYIQQSISHDHNETIIKNCVDLFECATIVDARQMIVRICRNQILEAYLKLPRHRKGPNKKELCIKDILQVFNLLPTEIAPIFVANERTSMSPDKQMTGNLLAMANEIAHLKGEVARLRALTERNHQQVLPTATEHQDSTTTPVAKSECDGILKDGDTHEIDVPQETLTWASIVAKRT